MVRLKDFWSDWPPPWKVFQFLMVRLKELRGVVFWWEWEFQFLMVRLKGFMSNFMLKFSYSISIPYGSIKSQQGNSLHGLITISIPYGSIKSAYRQRCELQILISIPYGSIKSSEYCSSSPALVISIPYGSIKRIVGWFAVAIIVLFQFLMVRLKVKNQSWITKIDAFQFLMVRLKAQPTHFFMTFSSISIPYGSIKRQIINSHVAKKRDFNSLWFD